MDNAVYRTKYPARFKIHLNEPGTFWTTLLANLDQMPLIRPSTLIEDFFTFQDMVRPLSLASAFQSSDGFLMDVIGAISFVLLGT